MYEVGMTVYKRGQPHRPGLVTKVLVQTETVWIRWADDYECPYRLSTYETLFRDMDKEIERRQAELRRWKQMRRHARRFK